MQHHKSIQHTSVKSSFDRGVDEGLAMPLWGQVLIFCLVFGIASWIAWRVFLRIVRAVGGAWRGKS